MITKNYIKMCEKAEEIQDKWRVPFKNYIGDLYWKGKKYLMIPEACCFVTEIMFEPKDDFIYLPTQEQLQEMINLDPITLIYLIDRFVAGGEGYWHSFAKAPYPDPSMDELWLAFVMKEKYNKIWIGKEWKNEK